MICPKCAGCLHHSFDPEMDMVEVYCINCGLRPMTITRPPERAPQGRPARARCRNCAQPPAPGYTQCQACRAYQRVYRKRTRAKQTVEA